MKNFRPYVIAIAGLLGLWACDRNPEENADAGLSKSEILSLQHALDSAELLYNDPEAIAIAQRVFKKLNFYSAHPLFIRTLRVSSLVLLSKKFPTRAELDSAVSFAYQAQQMALQNEDSIEWARSEIQVGRYHLLRSYWMRQHDGLGLASKSLLRAIEFLERKNETQGLSFAYHWLANATTTGKNFMSAVLRYKLRALEYNDSATYPNMRARIYNDLGTIYLSLLQDTVRAKVFFNRSMAILNRIEDKDLLTVVLGNFAELFSISGNIPRSHAYFREVARVAASAKLWERESGAYHQIARLFEASSNFDSAIFYNNRSVSVLREHHVDVTDVVVLQQAELARTYIAQGKRDLARKLVEALEVEIENTALQGGEITGVFENLRTLSSVYQALGDYRKLTAAQGKLLRIRDSLFSREQTVEIGRVENQYQIQLKNKEVEVLQLEAALQAENARKERWVRILLAIGILITTVALVLVLRLLRQKNAFNRSLADRNAIIERQKRELENALKELQRTQGYMLTSEKMVMLGQYTAGVAHELNNPLNFISGGVSVLDDVVDRFVVTKHDSGVQPTDELPSVLNNIRRGVDRMTSIVESLQIFSNPREIVTEKSETDVAECLDASIILIKSKLERSSVRITRNYSSVKVRGHSGRLSQVFINLIDNAVFALNSKPVGERNLSINMTTTDDEVLIMFEDNGAGIPEDVKNNIFEAFFTTKKTGEGTGLGLFICYSIIREAGGKITFSSEVGSGTTFTVSLVRSRF